MEGEILCALNFDLHEKPTLTFFDVKGEQYHIPTSVQSLGHFILELTLIQFEFCKKFPTYLSMAVLYTAMKLKKKRVSKIKLFAA